MGLASVVACLLFNTILGFAQPRSLAPARCQMYHGGTNYDRTAGGPLILTSYDYDAPLSELSHLPNEPKNGHLARLHKLILANGEALFWEGKGDEGGLLKVNAVWTDEHRIEPTSGTPISPAENWIESRVFGDPAPVSSTGQIAFISNIAVDAGVDVEWKGVKLKLKAWSVVILARKKGSEKADWEVVFDSAEVKAKNPKVEAEKVVTVSPTLVSIAPEPISAIPGTHPTDSRKSHARSLPNADQLRTALDTTDYQFHTLRYRLLKGARRMEVRATGLVEVGHVFADNGTCGGCVGGGTLVCSCHVGEGSGHHAAQSPVTSDELQIVNLTILTVTIGLDNYGARLEEVTKGITGKVEVDGVDVTDVEWKVVVGLYGESQKVGWRKTVSSGVFWKKS